MSRSAHEREKRMRIGLSFLEDTRYPIPTRIQNYREYLRNERIKKEKQIMLSFKQQNGFEATDDMAKRKLIDSMFYEQYQRMPKDDEERNEYAHSGRSLNIMSIGWRPSW